MIPVVVLVVVAEFTKDSLRGRVFFFFLLTATEHDLSGWLWLQKWEVACSHLGRSGREGNVHAQLNFSSLPLYSAQALSPGAAAAPIQVQPSSHSQSSLGTLSWTFEVCLSRYGSRQVDSRINHHLELGSCDHRCELESIPVMMCVTTHDFCPQASCPCSPGR